MKRSNLRIRWLMMFLIGSFFGCGWSGSDEEEMTLDESLPQLALSEPTPVDANAPATATAEEPTPQIQQSLSIGDRFPLVKTVTQTLSQPTPQGVQTSHSKLELLMSITVEEIQDDRKRLSVWYRRVRYSQQIAGAKIEFDSEFPQNPVPVEAQAYQGLVKNGFSFWTDADNRVFKLAHFDDFLKQCLINIPPAQRHKTLENLLGNSGEGGIATFIDENIGLLPYRLGSHGENSAVKVGDSWKKERRLTYPFPMQESNKCTLKSLSQTEAEVDIVGQITPVTPTSPPAANREPVSVRVRDGHTFGSCTIDRRTGLPLRSRVERHIDMIVHVNNGETFEQHKKIVTTIESLPQAGTTEPLPAAPPSNDSGIGQRITEGPLNNAFEIRRR